MSDNYSNEDLREAVGILLSMIDELMPPEMHWRGNTPDWYVAAAAMACNIEDTNPKCITYLRGKHGALGNFQKDALNAYREASK